MKLFAFITLVLAVLAIMMGSTAAAPKGAGGVIKKGGKIIRHGLTALGIAGTGHQVYQEAKNNG